MNRTTTTASIALTILSSPSLEDAPEYIGGGELVEITPAAIRLRKKVLEPGMRK
jgi:predicted membrane GTPase involved in stress response